MARSKAVAAVAKWTQYPWRLSSRKNSTKSSPAGRAGGRQGVHALGSQGVGDLLHQHIEGGICRVGLVEMEGLVE